jgi:hypothetical protein
MSILGRFFGNLCTGWAEGPCAPQAAEPCPPPPGQPTYLELIDRGPGEPPAHYPFADQAQHDCARSETLRLIDLVGSWKEECFAGEPKPDPVLRISPDM